VAVGCASNSASFGSSVVLIFLFLFRLEEVLSALLAHANRPTHVSILESQYS
jgi:hypothetical protein